MSKQIYILVRWDLVDKSETILKAYADETLAKRAMEELEKNVRDYRGRKVFHYFVEAELVEG